MQMPLQPRHGLGVEVVGRLVEEQNIRLAEQQPAQRHPPPLAARKRGDLLVFGWTAQRVHGHIQPTVQIPSPGRVELFGHGGLPLDQGVHGVVVHGFGELGVDVFVLAQQIYGLLHAFFDDLLDRLAFF